MSSLEVVVNNVPVGYTVPRFPSLYFPEISENAFNYSYLYYTRDIWRFTVLWTLIFYGVFHVGAAGWAMLMHRKLYLGGLWILVLYALLAGVQAIISGTIVGFVISAIYHAGLLGMSTWIPFVWGLIQVLFLVVTSYSSVSNVA
uniref:ARAD1B05412p n=1 Tax=Blastobotrys adeninivorans TaxID=409370 RepID=A0A060T4R8_BLAAD